MDDNFIKSKFNKKSGFFATLCPEKTSIYPAGRIFGKEEVDDLNDTSEKTTDAMSVGAAELRLIKEAKRGDAAAFGELYDSYKYDLYRFAVYMTGSKEDAEDAVQDTLMLSWKNIRRLKEPEKFKTWIFRILKNECTDILRKQKKNPQTVAFEDFENYLSSDEVGFSLTGSDLIEQVRSLPPPDGQLVLMSVIGGFNSVELSKIFGMSPAAVRSRLSRSMVALRKKLKEDYRIEIRK